MISSVGELEEANQDPKGGDLMRKDWHCFPCSCSFSREGTAGIYYQGRNEGLVASGDHRLVLPPVGRKERKV